MRVTPAVLVLVILLAGCGEEPPRRVSSGPSEADRLGELSSPEAATRRRAAQWLGGLESPSPSVVRALIRAQRDDEDAVVRAALEALDRIGPSSLLVERIEARGRFQDIVHVMVAPARVRWAEVTCQDVALREGEVLDACWRLAEIPPVIEARVKQFTPVPGAEISDPGDSIRHAWRLIRASEADLGEEGAPMGAPSAAQGGEVWCRVTTSKGNEWRRMPACEAPSDSD